ncbi:Calmodulin regulator protein PCP4 [Larimichthys crocea]|uniref:Uncharacterized protein n=1 Tax=Larimichthys crocea TaxID=215358 RepID=A0ACD3Q662_LARCR|nr:Calmodulin regulator protein PCP4 [Larimichthys crocea]
MASVSNNLREVLDPKEKMEGDEEEQEEELEENLDNSSLEDSQDQDLRMSLALSPASSSNHMLCSCVISSINYSAYLERVYSSSEIPNQEQFGVLPHDATATSSGEAAAATEHGEDCEDREDREVHFPLQKLPPRAVSKMSELASTNSANSSQTTAADNKEKASAAKPQEQEEEVDIDLEAPETEKAALAIQNQFRRFQKKKK